jgi:hypothetical protein
VFRPEECDDETLDSLKVSANNIPADKTPTKDKSETAPAATTSHSAENKSSVDVPRVSAQDDDILHQQSNDASKCEHGTGNAEHLNSAPSPSRSQASATGFNAAGTLPLIVIDECLDGASETTDERCESATEKAARDHPAAEQSPTSDAGAQRRDLLPDTRDADEDEGTKVHSKRLLSHVCALRRFPHFHYCLSVLIDLEPFLSEADEFHGGTCEALCTACNSNRRHTAMKVYTRVDSALVFGIF